MNTVDQDGNTVLDFYRCAMLPLSQSPDRNRVVHTDDLSAIGPQDDPQWTAPEGWNLDEYRSSVLARTSTRRWPGRSCSPAGT